MTPKAGNALDLPPSSPPALTRGRRLLTGALLSVSLACNLAVLFVPFMDLRIGLKKQPYSLFHSAAMLWSTGLQVLSVLVVAFSIVFPFVKLGVLAWLCGAGLGNPSHRRWLALVDRLGKWSMLDVFLVCLILALASGQLLVGARPLVGIPVFVTAIVLSMASGELLSAALPRASLSRTASMQASRRSGGWLALSGVALAGAMGLPFLRIHDWFVADKAYSIATVLPTLVRSGSLLPAVIIGLFLVVLPVATWSVTFAWWWQARSKRPDPTLYRLMQLGRRWSMLDVFGLALAIFAVEGGYLMKTEVRWGALFLAALVGGQLALQSAIGRPSRRD
ncbi:MAG: paraquat-inducible protein A [Opitutaceae bacterium]